MHRKSFRARGASDCAYGCGKKITPGQLVIMVYAQRRTAHLTCYLELKKAREELVKSPYVVKPAGYREPGPRPPRQGEAWTPDELAHTRAWWNDGLGADDIAAKIGRSSKAVIIQLQRMGLVERDLVLDEPLHYQHNQHESDMKETPPGN